MPQNVCDSCGEEIDTKTLNGHNICWVCEDNGWTYNNPKIDEVN